MIYRFDYEDCSYQAEIDVTYSPGRPATGPTMENAGGDPPEPAECEIKIERLWALENGERILLEPRAQWPCHEYLEEFLNGDGQDDVIEAYVDYIAHDFDAENDRMADR